MHKTKESLIRTHSQTLIFFNLTNTFFGGGVHSTNMLSIYSVPGPILDTWDTTVIKTDKYPTGALHFVRIITHILYERKEIQGDIKLFAHSQTPRK